MKFYFLILAIYYLTNIQGQDSTAYKSTYIDSIGWIEPIFRPHYPARDGSITSVCVKALNKNYSSCIYFYEETQAVKAKGKENSEQEKIGKWLYFYEDGKRCGIAHFSKNGDKKGLWKYYQTTGRLGKMIQIKNKKIGMLHQKGKPRSEVPLTGILEPLSILFQ
jgi:hypothetical protein